MKNAVDDVFCSSGYFDDLHSCIERGTDVGQFECSHSGCFANDAYLLSPYMMTASNVTTIIAAAAISMSSIKPVQPRPGSIGLMLT